MWEIRANKMLPKALKSCPECKKSPNLVTLVTSPDTFSPQEREKVDKMFDHFDRLMGFQGFSCFSVLLESLTQTHPSTVPWQHQRQSFHSRTHSTCIYYISQENIHSRRKDYCTAGLQLNKVGFDRKENVVKFLCSEAVKSKLLKLGPVVQWYFPQWYNFIFFTWICVTTFTSSVQQLSFSIE